VLFKEPSKQTTSTFRIKVSTIARQFSTMSEHFRDRNTKYTTWWLGVNQWIALGYFHFTENFQVYLPKTSPSTTFDGSNSALSTLKSSANKVVCLLRRILNCLKEITLKRKFIFSRDGHTPILQFHVLCCSMLDSTVSKIFGNMSRTHGILEYMSIVYLSCILTMGRHYY
jgi:hypothetical protein